MGSRLGVGGSAYHHGTRPQEVDHLPFGAYPTALVRELGGWDENLVANEDFEFDYRLREAGHPLLFDPGLVIRWHCRQSIGDLYRQYHRYGRGKVDVAWLHPESLRPRHIAPPPSSPTPRSALALTPGIPGRLGHARAVRRAVLAGSVWPAGARPAPRGCACPPRSSPCTSAGASASGPAPDGWHGLGPRWLPERCDQDVPC